jgi:hypothetical protein
MCPQVKVSNGRRAADDLECVCCPAGDPSAVTYLEHHHHGGQPVTVTTLHVGFVFKAVLPGSIKVLAEPGCCACAVERGLLSQCAVTRATSCHALLISTPQPDATAHSAHK